MSWNEVIIYFIVHLTLWTIDITFEVEKFLFGCKNFYCCIEHYENDTNIYHDP